jgi:hypothetical protein
MDSDLKPLTIDHSLIGPYPHIYPEEEWIRREIKGGIQILAMPQPVHPQC